MSELQEKLARRRSQLTGHGLTPPPAGAPEIVRRILLFSSEATEPNGVVEKPVATPVPVDSIPTPDEKNEAGAFEP